MLDSPAMKKSAAMALAGVVWLAAGMDAWALEFMADQITRIDGHSRKALIYYRDDRWRLEHFDAGPVNVTIVRKDKDVMWLLLSRMRHFKTVPYDPEQAPKVREQLDGEVTREAIGNETVDGRPTKLYEGTVRKGARQEICIRVMQTDISVS